MALSIDIFFNLINRLVIFYKVIYRFLSIIYLKFYASQELVGKGIDSKLNYHPYVIGQLSVVIRDKSLPVSLKSFY